VRSPLSVSYGVDLCRAAAARAADCLGRSPPFPPAEAHCAFQAYVDQVLVPYLRSGDIVIMDNFGSHKRPGIRAAIEVAGASLLYLPPCSPDFNPIENAFAKLKAMLRKVAARTIEGLWSAVGSIIDTFNPIECVNYFAAAGYDPAWSENALRETCAREACGAW